MNTRKDTIHRPVMLSESMDALSPHAGGVYLDATLGGAGHSLEILKRATNIEYGISNIANQPRHSTFSEADIRHSRLLSLDVDPAALARAEKLAKEHQGRWIIKESNFRNLKQAAKEAGMDCFDGILFDLGLSSDELEDASKGLSFQKDGPLDMRLGPKANDDELTAADIVNRWSLPELIKLLRVFGEETYAVKIAQAMVNRRKVQAFATTLDLAQVIKDAVPPAYRNGRIHPATKTFQALRIAVNDELESLKIALADAYDLLAPGGTLAVISFHSLEDRIVKQTFKKFQNSSVTKKPILPTEQEIKINPRSRSAKLRAANKNQIQNKLCRATMHLL
ncbi:MAG: 16S rRNA (cytosine(1402)-N(4))-methyltransferase RsmH [Patescibacteria group bacterium]